MKTLIVYYSFTQNNKKLAFYLQNQLKCDVAEIETNRTRNGLSILLDLVFNRKPEIKPIPYSLHDHEYIIFIAPIWAGRIAMPMKSFMLKEKENIKYYSFITLCGGRSGQKEKILTELVATLKKEPVKLLELWINDLLSTEKKDTIRSTSSFRIEAGGFAHFEGQLLDFIKEKNIVESD